jgi:hypothetical protein
MSSERKPDVGLLTGPIVEGLKQINVNSEIGKTDDGQLQTLKNHFRNCKS